MAYFGKRFNLEQQDNYEDFVSSLDIPTESLEALMKTQSSHKIVKNGDTYTWTLNMGPIAKEQVFKSGVTFGDSDDKDAARITITVDGDTFTEVQKFANGRILTFKKHFSENKVKETITNSAWDGVAYRYYTAEIK